MRAQIARGANRTYKLDALDRRVVGALQWMGLWSNTSIGAAYGIDRAAVSRHGATHRLALGVVPGASS